MPSYGPNPCSTVTQIGVGNAWNNPNNIKLNDGNSADCEPWQLVYGPGPVIIGKDPYQSQTLHTVGYGFTVPTYYAISRVKVSVWRYETNPRYPGTSVKDLQIQLVVAGVASGTNKAATSASGSATARPRSTISSPRRASSPRPRSSGENHAAVTSVTTSRASAASGAVATSSGELTLAGRRRSSEHRRHREHERKDGGFDGDRAPHSGRTARGGTGRGRD